MVAKTTMNDRHGISFVAAGASRIARELGELAQMEVRLLAADAREARRKVVPGAVLLAVGIAGGLATLPILLAAAALGLAAATAWPLATCLAVVGAIGLATAVGAARIGWRRVVDAAKSFQRSQDEWDATIQCLRQALSSTRGRQP